MTGKAPSVWWSVLAWLVVLNSSAAADRLIYPETTIAVPMQGGQAHTVRVAESGSAYLFVDQIGIDVKISVLDVNDAEIMWTNAAGERNTREVLQLPSGAAAVRLSATNPSASPGLARLHLHLGQLQGLQHLLAAGHMNFAQGRAAPTDTSICGGSAASGYAAAALCYATAAQQYPTENASPLFLQADAVRASSNYEHAIELYAVAEERAKAQQSAETLGAVYAGWGWSLSRQGHYDQARSILNRALVVVTKLAEAEPEHRGFQYDLGSVQNNLCLQDLRQDRLNSAERCLAGLELKTRTNGDTNLRLLALNGLGGFHRMVGQPDAAIAHFEEALRLATVNGDRRREALFHNNLGWTYRASSEYAKGIQHAIRATQISSQLAWSDQTALAQANLGRLYALVGDYDRARHWYGVAIEGGKQDRRLASRYLSLGDVELAQERPAEALAAYQAGASIADRLEAPRLQLAAADKLIRAHLMLGNLNDIGPISTAAEQHAQRVEDRLSQASFNLAVGEYRLAVNDPGGALSRFQKALPEYEELGFSTGIADAHFGLARYWFSRSDWARAEQHINAAIQSLEATRANLWTLFERINFNRIGQGIYAFAIDLQMRQHFQTGDNKRAMAGLLLAERRKAQTLAELVGAMGAPASDAGEPTDAAASAVRRRVASLQAQLLQFNVQPEGAALSDQLQNRLKAEYFMALDELQSLELTAASVSSQVWSVASPLDLLALSTPDRSVVSFYVGRAHSYAWRIDDGQLTALLLPGREDIESTVRRLLAALRVPGEPAAASQYGGRVISGLQRTLSVPPQARGHRLLISADGPLHLLPFAALPMADGQPLVTLAEITMSPGLGVASRSVAVRTGERRALVLADPVFSAADRRLGEHRVAGSPDDKLGLARLPGTRAEADVLAELIGDDQLSTLMGFDATRENLLSQPLDQFDLIHFGTHGLLDPETPDGFGLALTRVNATGTPLNWLLSIHDIARLGLTSRIVVLSGCETAQGEQIDGAGIVGLTRAFLYAGSNQVMSSLWQVSDRSTAKLMRQFYLGYLAQSWTPARALREAQLSMLQQADRSHPYHWAAFAISAGAGLGAGP